MPLVSSFVLEKCKVTRKLIEGETREAYILCICRCCAPVPLCSLEICWLTALHASSFPLPLPLPTNLSLSSPPSPSFWWVGSSEVVAVCIAKGNVSSTHRKMGQNITALTAHAQWLTQCWGYNRGVNQITVSSHISCHAWMFPLLTPVFSHQLLTAHNSSRLSSPLLQSVWSNAVVWTRRRQRRGYQFVNSADAFFILFPPVLFYAYPPDVPHLNHLQTCVGIENRHTHTHARPHGAPM